MSRSYAAVTTFRTVTRETEFKGVKMMPGDKVRMSTAITSRDPEAWTNPNEVDFNRKPGHLAYGSSSHRCMGTPLARRAHIIAMDPLLTEVTAIRVAPDGASPYSLGHILKVTARPAWWCMQA